jgi:hypothetical protein
LQSNDATAAFAGLIDAQTIEDKASSYKGSAPEEKDEDEEDVKPKKKPMPKIKPKKKILAKKKAPKKKKADAALVGATEEISESSESYHRLLKPPKQQKSQSFLKRKAR